MAPRNLTINDAILAFEAASEKRPPKQHFDFEVPVPKIDLRPFTAWLEHDRDSRRRFHKLVRRINRVYAASLKARQPLTRYLRDLPTVKPYTNMKLTQELNWFNAQAAKFGISTEMIQWQLLDAR
jgi:hypothetical protein